MVMPNQPIHLSIHLLTVYQSTPGTFGGVVQLITTRKSRVQGVEGNRNDFSLRLKSASLGTHLDISELPY